MIQAADLRFADLDVLLQSVMDVCEPLVAGLALPANLDNDIVAIGPIAGRNLLHSAMPTA